MTKQKLHNPLSSEPTMAPNSVLVMPFSITNWVYEGLIPHMRETHGTRFVILAASDRCDEIRNSWCGPEDKVISLKEIESSCDAGIGGTAAEEAAWARNMEAQLGIVYMQDVVQQDRQLSSAFLSHAPWTPFAAMGIPQTDSLIRQINGYISFAESIINKEKIDLALVWPVTALAASITAVAEGKGIPVSYPYVSSRKGLLYWSSSAYSDDSLHRASFEQVPECSPVPATDVLPPDSITSEIASMDKDHSLSGVLKAVARLVFHRIEFLYLDLKKLDFRIKPRSSLWRGVLQQGYKWWFYRKLGAISERRIEAFGEKPFLYFSLSLEPEFSVQARTKEFNNQAAIIRQIAMSLPAGCELVVKEHVLLGRRHISFYEDLAKFPNIRMAHPSIHGIDLAARSRAVATLAGSVTLEAALLGKPVIEFSMHSVFSFMPHVTTVTSLHELPDVLREAMRLRSEEEHDDTRRAGARMVKAIESISFDGEGSPIFRKNTIQMDQTYVAHMCRLLISLFQAKKADINENFATFP